ncbi:MAG: hypothetical protein GWN71_27485, partial [Gammaproteobacteria bacterium]|nr:hypothetical protein [Gemmatimonadota bacterium]NIU77155.1 hypothetical protein [Gammaproteobacteria bacterium]NIY10792.1 hypothetical protein [Gemmatimonadota bacterium]
LNRKIPVEIVSRSAAVHDGRLELYARHGRYTEEEVRRDALLALRAAGLDLAEVDRERLGELVAFTRRTSVSAPLEELVAAEPAGGLDRGA